MTVSQLEAALDYARSGWAVFPVGRDKAPLTANGFKDASSDPAEVALLFVGKDDANVALAIPDDIVVIDIDPRNGGRRDAFDFPPTREVRTPGGGWHLYYRVDPEDRFRGQLAPGIDVKKGGKGYVLLPPSRNGSDTPYEWVARTEVGYEAQLSDELFGLLCKDLKPAPPPAGATTPYGQRALEGELGRLLATPAGDRNNALNRAGFAIGQLVGAGQVDLEDASEQLATAAERMGLDPVEIERTLDHALADGIAEPRELPSSFTQTLVNDDDFWLDWEGEDEPVRWLMEPFFPAGAYVLVFGPTQASKSMVLRWAAAQMSRAGLRVSYYSLENPAVVDRRDLQRLRPSTDPDYFRISNHMLNLADPAQLEDMVRREQGRDLIVLDTYVHAFSPSGAGGDENAMAVDFARRARYIIKQTGATLVVVDHSGFEIRDDPRGASAKRQQVDIAIAMASDPWMGPGHAASFTMRNVKSARFANPFTVTGQILDTDDGLLEVRIHGVDHDTFARDQTIPFAQRRALLKEEKA